MAPLRQGDQQPREQKSEQHAAIVAEKDACPTVAWITQVVIQESPDTAHQGSDENDIAAGIAGISHQGDQRQTDHAHRSGQTIDAVDHVHGVDQADGSEDRQGDA
jgi:hypothetical protein